MKSILEYKLELRAMLEQSPYLAKLEDFSDEDLLGKLGENGLAIDSQSLFSLMAKFEGVESLRAFLLAEKSIEDETDWIYACLIELWTRWQPERPTIEYIYDLIGKGNLLQGRLQSAASADYYQRAWHEITKMMSRAGMTSLAEFDAKYPDAPYEFQIIFVELASTLCDRGHDDIRYYERCISFCTELLKYLPEGNEDYRDTLEGIRSYLASSYARRGESQKAIELLEQWLAADPTWGWGWIDLADVYTDPPRNDYAKAGQILRKALAVSNLRDCMDVMDCCSEILGELLAA